MSFTSTLNHFFIIIIIIVGVAFTLSGTYSFPEQSRFNWFVRTSKLAWQSNSYLLGDSTLLIALRAWLKLLLVNIYYVRAFSFSSSSSFSFCFIPILIYFRFSSFVRSIPIRLDSLLWRKHSALLGSNSKCTNTPTHKERKKERKSLKSRT